jgi:hypothetical protein
MFDDLPLPYLASLHFLKISRTLLLSLTRLNYPFPCPLFESDLFAGESFQHFCRQLVPVLDGPIYKIN